MLQLVSKEVNMQGADPIIGFTVEIVVQPDEEGFHAYCPALKGLHVGGETEEEVLQNAADASILYVESLIRHGEPIPIGVGVQTHGEPSKQPSHGIAYHTEELKVTCPL